MPQDKKALMERINRGEKVILAEGYLFEFERRGYLKAGAFVPEVVIEHPHLVRDLYREFVHAGSDVVLAFTYYGHREKLRVIGREADLEKMNRTALRMAREVADETGTLMAGNICNTTAYIPNDPSTHKAVKDMYKEEIEWAVEEGADFILGETIGHLGEALIAVEAVKEYGQGLPMVINMTVFTEDLTYDNVPIVEAMQKLEAAGADVIGINCSRGPVTIMPTMKKIREAVKIPLCAAPVCYRTSEEYPSMQSLVDPRTGERSFPENLDVWNCGRNEIHWFGEEAAATNIAVIGLCCGNMGHYTRTLAESLGRKPPASRYSADMSLHYIFSKNAEKFQEHYHNFRKLMCGPEMKHPEERKPAQ